MGGDGPVTGATEGAAPAAPVRTEWIVQARQSTGRWLMVGGSVYASREQAAEVLTRVLARRGPTATAEYRVAFRQVTEWKAAL